MNWEKRRVKLKLHCNTNWSIFLPEDLRMLSWLLAGLLARPTFCGLPKAPFPPPKGRNYPPKEVSASVAEWCSKRCPVLSLGEVGGAMRLTAAGTAPVLHRIPFSDSLLQTKRFVTKNRFKSRKLSGINRTTLNVEQIETAEKKNCRQGGRQHQMPQLWKK